VLTTAVALFIALNVLCDVCDRRVGAPTRP
jgi:hypothetical protein